MPTEAKGRVITLPTQIHPEIQPGEYYLGNRIQSEIDFITGVGIQSARKGEKTYKESGEEFSLENIWPVFAQKTEVDAFEADVVAFEKNLHRGPIIPFRL